MASNRLPENLVDVVQRQNAILFLGAGASYDAVHSNHLKIPNGNELRDRICDRFLNGRLKDRTLAQVSGFAQNEVGPQQFQDFIRAEFEGFHPADFHLLVPSFRWRAIVTTNFDLITERSFASNSSGQNLVKFVKDSQSFDRDLRASSDPLEFIKLHGCIDHHHDESIPMILSSDQYVTYLKNRKRLISRFTELAHENSIIFCGYGIEDPHIQQILFDLSDDEIPRPMYFYVSPNIDDYESDYWAKRRVKCVKSTFQQFVEEIDQRVPQLSRGLPAKTGGGILTTRTHYAVAGADESSSLRQFIETDAIHVHADMAVEGQSPQDFYRGYDPGFGGIAQDLDVRRNVSDSVLVETVLDEEENKSAFQFFLLRGPAGSGKTVCLKRIAYEAGINYERLALLVRDEGALRIEALRELYSLSGRRIYLFIDRLAIWRNEVRDLIAFSKKYDVKITLVAAETDNEWNTYCSDLSKDVDQEFPVRDLSRNEISDLLDLLEKHKCLGLLSSIPKNERIESFVNSSSRQLLVALHELTLGRPFEEIIIDQFKRIEPEEARSFYLDICTLDQFGVGVRAGLIKRVLGIEYNDFKDRLHENLHNVVIAREEKYIRDHIYSARHSHIASIVYAEIQSEPDARYDRLIRILSQMNLGYSTDRIAFERIFRGREIAKSFASIDLGRLLFDKAFEVAPDDPFLFQQRALLEMHHNGGSVVSAERLVSKAAALNPVSRSIRHTEADVSRRLAQTTDDPLQKKAYRRRAREKLGDLVSSHDEYEFNTRVSLAIDELQDLLRESSAAPVAVFVEKVRDITVSIGRALQAYPESSVIRGSEARFQELLDEDGKALKTLEDAFAINPRQDWLAVRLSQRMVANGDIQGALSVLQKCLQENPSSKLVNLEIARNLIATNGDADGIILHLKRGFTDGDANFEAQFWYFRQLFIKQEYGAAKDGFSNLNQRAPSKFRTMPSAVVDGEGGPLSYSGYVRRIEEGYAFVAYDGLPFDVFASRADTSVESHWQELRQGARVVSQIAFCRRGPRAINLKPAD